MKRLYIFGFILGLLASACYHKLNLESAPVIRNPVVNVVSNPEEPFQAGFAKGIITPDRPVWMAGFDFLRRSNGVHDDLFVRVLVLKQGEEKLALVSMDLVGLQYHDVEKLKGNVPGFRSDQILIACTHTHSGPDTMGIWGLPPLYSGRDESFMEKVQEQTVQTIKNAEQVLKPVSVWTAVYLMNPALMYNQNHPEPKDDTMGIMVFKSQSGEPMAILINITGHPEVMWRNNRKISADYPGVLYRLVEKKYGGGVIFFNGALGSLISPNLPKPEENHTWEDLEKFGQELAKEVDRGMEMLVQEQNPSIIHHASLVHARVSNKIYPILVASGMIERKVYEGPSFVTLVHLLEIGSAQFITFPAEAYPKQGLKIRALQKPHSFQIGLADDEFGYILYPEDYGTETYSYESSLCPGPDLALQIDLALTELLKH